jgi:X-linked retinitis pigmentosa GTPase regulator
VVLYFLCRDVYALMGEKIKPLLSSSGKYADSQAGNNVEVLELLKFYQSLGAQVKALLEKSAKQYARLRIKIPLELDQKSAPTAEAVAQRIRELSSGPSTSLSGGALAADTARSSSAAQGSDSRGGQHSQETSSAEKKRVLHKADRPLTPEEVQLSAELAGQRCYASMSQASQRSPARISSPLKEKGMWQGSGGATEDEDEDEAGEEEDEVADEEEGDEDEADEAEEGVTEEDADEEEEDCQDCGADHHASRHDAGDDEDAEDTEEAAQEEDGDLQEEADGEDDEDAEPAGEEEGEAEEEEGEGDGEEPEDDGADAEADEEGEGEGDDEGEGEDEDADGDVDTEDDE